MCDSAIIIRTLIRLIWAILYSRASTNPDNETLPSFLTHRLSHRLLRHDVIRRHGEKGAIVRRTALQVGGLRLIYHRAGPTGARLLAGAMAGSSRILWLIRPMGLCQTVHVCRTPTRGR